MMLTLMVTLSMSVALTIPLATAPLSLGAWILILAILFSIITAMTTSSWFGLILFIIYVSGMLVMFSYFTAISPNQQLHMSNMLYSLLITLILTFIFFFSKSVLAPSLSFSKNTYNSPNLTYFYTSHLIPTLILLGILLLLALILVVKIVEHKKGPLRPFL